MATGRSIVWLRDEAGNADPGNAAEATSPPRHHRPLTRLPQRAQRAGGGPRRDVRRAQRRRRRADPDPSARRRRLAIARDASRGHRSRRRDPGRAVRARHVRAPGHRDGCRRQQRHHEPAKGRARDGPRPPAARRHHPQRNAVPPRRQVRDAPGRASAIGYRKRAWLRGVLRSGGALLPDTRIADRTRAGSPAATGSTLTELVTDGNGRYGVRLPRGASREVRVQLPRQPVAAPATDVVTLLVRGWAKLRLQPRYAAPWRHDHVPRSRRAVPGARCPRAGKLIQIQYLDGRKWRPAVKLGHTNAARALPDPLPLPPHQPPDADLLPDPRARRGRLALYDGRVEASGPPSSGRSFVGAFRGKTCAIPQTVVHARPVSL